MMTYEKLKVYQLSLECVERCFHLLDHRQKGHTNLYSQLKRAIVSVSLNIAEGSGKSGLVDKRRYYEIAKGSAMESAAVCDILYRAKLIREQEYQNCKNLLWQIVSMLSQLCLNLQSKIDEKEKREGKGQGQGKGIENCG